MHLKELAMAIMTVDSLAFIASLLFTIGVAPAHLEGISDPNTDAGSLLRHSLLPFILATVLPLVAIWGNTWLTGMAMARDEAFSTANARRLRNIGIAALIEALLYLGITALAWFGARFDPNALTIALLVVLACLALATVAFALSHLIAQAAELQQENNLTV